MKKSTDFYGFLRIGTEKKEASNSVLIRTHPYSSVLIRTNPYSSVLIRTHPYSSVLIRTKIVSAFDLWAVSKDIRQEGQRIAVKFAGDHHQSFAAGTAENAALFFPFPGTQRKHNVVYFPEK